LKLATHDERKAHELVRYVFERPAGSVGQELGGIGVTALALAATAGLSADEEEFREVNRVLSKPIHQAQREQERGRLSGRGIRGRQSRSDRHCGADCDGRRTLPSGPSA